MFTSLKKFSFLILFFGTMLSAAFRCPICGMDTTATSKVGFDSMYKGKEVYFCSYVCAHRFHKKKLGELFAHDYLSNEKIPALKAIYLLESDKLHKLLPFSMPPVVIAFKSQDDAKKTRDELKEGKIVEGFDAVKAALD